MIFLGREFEDKRMVRLDFYFHFQKFWAYLKKISTFTFGAWSFLLVHIWFTLSVGPKGFVNYLFDELYHGRDLRILVLRAFVGGLLRATFMPVQPAPNLHPRTMSMLSSSSLPCAAGEVLHSGAMCWAL
jgi:hypothetical protein